MLRWPKTPLLRDEARKKGKKVRSGDFNPAFLRSEVAINVDVVLAKPFGDVVLEFAGFTNGLALGGFF